MHHLFLACNFIRFFSFHLLSCIVWLQFFSRSLFLSPWITRCHHQILCSLLIAFSRSVSSGTNQILQTTGSLEAFRWWPNCTVKTGPFISLFVAILNSLLFKGSHILFLVTLSLPEPLVEEPCVTDGSGSPLNHLNHLVQSLGWGLCLLQNQPVTPHSTGRQQYDLFKMIWQNSYEFDRI